MAHRPDSEPTRKRILQTCVRLFLEQGYKKTTMTEIIQEGNVSSSSFQNHVLTRNDSRSPIPSPSRNSRSCCVRRHI